jgi:signal transduction histidine kinase/CheY-like chemotaxis protein
MRSFPRAASAFAILVGFWVLAGWNFGAPILQVLLIGQAKMKPNAAFAFILSGVSLWLLQKDSLGRGSRTVAQVCAFIVLLIGALTLSEHTFGTDFGIDGLLQRGSATTLGVMFPLRISPPNTINLILIGVALLLLAAKNLHSKWLHQAPAIAAVVTPSVAMIGHLHKMPALYTIGSNIEMAWITAMTVIALCFGIIGTRPEGGLTIIVARIRFSLVPQVIALVVAAALLAGGLVSIVMARQSQTALRKQIIATNLAAADLTAEFAWRYMQGAQMSVEFFSRSQHVLEAVLSGNFKQATPDLQEFLKANTWLSICSLFDSTGNMSASGSIRPSFVGGSVGDREWFQQAVATRKPYLGLPTLSRGTKRPVVPYAIPILDRKGKVLGVLLGGISISALSDAIGKVQSGPGVRVSIADRRQGGMILAHPDPDRILKAVSGRNEAGVRMSHRERGAMETTDTEGHAVLAAFAPVPNLPWGVLILQPSQTAFAPVRTSLNRTQLWTSILLLVTASVAGWLAQRVTRPLVHLREVATALAKGRRSAPINPTRQDEVGDLGRAFDHMAAALAERTAQLEAANEDLGEQNRRIQQADRLKSEFLANMSHELRTPLNAIIGFAEIMHDGKVGPVSSQHKEYLGDVLTSARHLLQLINDILDLSKVEAGKMEFRPARINLAVVVQEARAIVRTMAAKKRINLRSEIDPSLCEIEADPKSLKQILYNYLSNALKFTLEGGVVTVRARPEDVDHFRIEVEDSGIGIKAEDRQRLFVEFQQLDASAGKKYSGTGLGLALTKKIVEAQGGRVGVNSTPGTGSAFYAVLPRFPRASNQIVEETKSVTAPTENPLILTIEHDDHDRLRIAGQLRNAGFAVESVATGFEAVARCHQIRFDAITLDIRLPDMSGQAVLRKMRERGLNQQTPVIIATVLDAQGAVAGFRVDEILSKPMSKSDLLEAFERSGVPPSSTHPILVLDNDQAALQLADELLRRSGYRAVCRQDAASAVKTAAHEHPAAVILDPVTAQLNGLGFLKEFRKTSVGRMTPVMVWTGHELAGLDHHEFRPAANSVVVKDGQAQELIDELKQILWHPNPAAAIVERGEASPLGHT